jgi:hypothetical protein
MAKVSNGTDQSGERLTWWTRYRVPAAPVILGMAILSVAVAFGYWQISDSRHDAEVALERQACETQELSPEAREFAISLAPVVEAGRERDERALADYVLRFPIPRCDEL